MFRLTIRDMLWLTALVAVGVAWCIDRSRAVEEGIQIANRRASWPRIYINNPDEGWVSRVVQPGDALLVQINDDGGTRMSRIRGGGRDGATTVTITP